MYDEFESGTRAAPSVGSQMILWEHASWKRRNGSIGFPHARRRELEQMPVRVPKVKAPAAFLPELVPLGGPSVYVVTVARDQGRILPLRVCYLADPLDAKHEAHSSGPYLWMHL